MNLRRFIAASMVMFVVSPLAACSNSNTKERSNAGPGITMEQSDTERRINEELVRNLEIGNAREKPCCPEIEDENRKKIEAFNQARRSGRTTRNNGKLQSQEDIEKDIMRQLCENMVEVVYDKCGRVTKIISMECKEQLSP